MKHDTTHYKKLLEEEKATLIKELQGVGIVKDEKNPDDWQAVSGDSELQRPDSNEVADKIESFEGNNALVHSLEPRLLEVDYTLHKIEKGTFGICEVCNEPIEEDRLEANPAARTCKKHLKEHLPEPIL